MNQLQRTRDTVSNITAIVLCTCAVVLAVAGTILLIKAVIR